MSRPPRNGKGLAGLGRQGFTPFAAGFPTRSLHRPKPLVVTRIFPGMLHSVPELPACPRVPLTSLGPEMAAPAPVFG